MILVLCDEADASASWAAEAMRMRGKALVVVTGADLAAAERWEHRVGAAGADCELHLAGGARLRGRDTEGVLNRLSYLPAAWLRRFSSPDRDYAVQEMYAFYLSWMHALPGPKLNAPTPQGLCGNPRHPSAWTALAAQAGLPVRPFRQSSADDPALLWQTQPGHATVYVVGARVVGPPALVWAHRAACLRLAKASGAMMLGIAFAADAGGAWHMSGATVMPDLIGGGEPLADALAAALSP
jgi:hypothetical protein